jgi:hypothetical protein
MADKVKVRTIRPHDTTEGMKAPGEEYERSKVDADVLTELGVVESATVRTAKRR